MDKIIKDGKVAVAISYGFGAGWSTWSDVSPTDAEFNQLFIDKDLNGVRKLAKSKDFYDGGVDQVEIIWVEEGALFKISDYDGSESIEFKDPADWSIA